MMDAETIAKALEDRDKIAATCPVNSPRWRGGASSCPKCRAGSGHACPVISGADYGFVEVARALLSERKHT